MSNNITILDSTGATITIHTIDDGSGIQFNQSIPTDSAGNVATVVSSGQAVAGTMGALVVAQRDALPAGTNHLGKVSVAGIVTVNGIVSIAPQTFNTSVAGIVSAHQDGTWTVDIGTALPAGTNVIGGVSIVGTPTVGVQGAVSIAGISQVSVAGVVSAHQDGTWAVDINAGTNIIGKVSSAGVVSVHIVGTDLGTGGTIVTSVGGAASVQAVPIAGRDSSGNVRQPLMYSDGTQRVGGLTTNPEYVFSRPGDTNTYAIGDAVGNSTTAGSVIPMKFPVSRFSSGGGSFVIRRARLITATDNRTDDRIYRMHFINGITASVAGGDNAAFSPSPVSAYAGYIDIPMFLSATTGAAGIGTGDINIQLATGQVSIQALLEARTSILPANAATYRGILEIVHD